MPDSSFYDGAIAYTQSVLGYVIPPVLAAALSGYAVHRWKGRTDYVEKRLDELCETITKTADIASEYWRTDQREGDAIINEAKLQAGLTQIAGLRVSLEGMLSASASNEMRTAESAFLRETTGGNFGVHNREADLLRVASSQFSAAEFVVRVRDARMKDLRGFRQRK